MSLKILTGVLLCLLLILGGCIQIKLVEEKTDLSGEETIVSPLTEGNVTEEVEVNATEEVEANVTEEENVTAEEIVNATKIEEVEEETVEVAEKEIEEEKKQEITATEGDLIQLKVQATDPDGNPLTYSFSEPLNSSGAWQTQDGDAGDYDITVTVTDSEGLSASQELKITVLPMNHPPVLEKIDPIVVDEGDTITLEPVVSDPDNDTLEISYSGWMNSSTYTTTYDDAGNYTVTIKVTDGIETVSRDVLITVNNKNRAPVISSISLA